MSKSEIGIKLTLTGQQQVQQGLGQVASKASQLGDEFDAVRGRVGAAMVAMGVGVGVLVSKVSDSAAQIERFAQLASSTPAEFQRFAAGARSAGMGMEKFADVAKDVQDKIGDFLLNESGELKDFFDKIAPTVGVTAEEFRNLSGPQGLQLFYNSLQKAGLSQSEVITQMEALADDAALLIPVLQANGAGFDAASEMAKKYGANLSDYALAAAKDFKRQTDEMSVAIEGATNTLAVGLMPTLSETARAMLQYGTDTEVAEAATAVIRTTLETLVIVASDVAFTFKTVGREIGGMSAQAAAFLSFDFSRAGQIGDMMRQDAATARAELDAFQKRLLNAGQTSKDVFGLTTVMKQNKAGTVEYNAALTEMIRLKDAGMLSVSQYTTAIKDSTSAVSGMSRAEVNSAADAAVAQQKIREEYKSTADKRKEALDKARKAFGGVIPAELEKEIRDKFKDPVSDAAKATASAAKESAKAFADAWGDGAKMLRGLTAEEQNLNEAEKALAEVMAGDHWAKWTAAQQGAVKAIYDRTSAAIAARTAEQADAKWLDESASANADLAESLDAATVALQEQFKEQLQTNEAIGLSGVALAELEAARLDDAAAEKIRRAAMMDGIDPAIAAQYREQASALTGLAQAKRDGAVAEAGVESAKEAADEWKRTADKVEDALIDALMAGGKSGAEYIEGLFRSMVLRPVLQAIVSPVAGAVTSAMGFGGPAQAGQSAGIGVGGVYSAYKTATTGAGWFTNFGGSLSNSAYNVAGDLTRAGFETAGDAAFQVASSLREYADVINTGGQVLGYLNAAALATNGQWGAAIGSAAGTYFGGPIGSMVGQQIGSLVDDFFAGDSGTPHTGGAGGYSAARGTFRTNDNLKAGDWWNNGYDKTAGGIKGAQELSKILATTLDAAATTFGQKAGHEVWTGFADDASSDAAWSRLFIKNLEGVLVNTDKQFADGEKGQAEYAQYLADATRDVLEGMDLPGWADAMLEGLGDTPTVEQLTQAVAHFADVQAALVNLGDYMPQLANLSEEAASQMMRFFGGAENMVAASANYYQAFYTEAERADVATRQLTDALAEIGINAMPATRDAYRDLVESQDLTTESGRETYAALMGLSGAFAALVPAMQSASAIVEDIEQAYQRLTNVTFTAEQAAEQRIGLEEKLLTLQGNTAELRRRELQAIDASNRGLQRLVWALDDVQTASASVLDAEKKLADAQAQAQQQQYDTQYEAAKAIADAARAAADEMKSLADTLRDFVLGETLTPSELFADTLKKALGGDVDAMRALPQAANAQMDTARQSALTQADYAIARAQTLNAINQAASVAAQLGGAVTVVDPVRQIVDVTESTLAPDPVQAALGELNTAIEILTMSIATAVGGDLADKLGKIDTNLDGSVSETEFKAAFNGTASDNVLSKIFNALDSDSSKIITRLESIKGSSSALVTSFGAFAVRAASDVVSQTGSLSTSDLSAVLSGGKSTSASSQVASAIDFDKSGFVTQAEASIAKIVSNVADSYASNVSTSYISGATSNAAQNISSDLSSVYKSLLGRDVDISGASYYSGKSIESVIADIKSSQEYAVRNVYGISAQNLMNDLVNAQIGVINDTKSFHTGGYTGPGGKYEAAGVVHRGEVVFSQDDIARLGGVRAVEAIRTGEMPGYATGGAVGAPVVVPAPLVPGRVAMAPRPATPDPVQQERDAQARDQAQREAQQQTQDLIAQLRQVNSNLTDLKRSVDKSGQSNDQMNNKIFNMADTTVKLLRKFDALGLPVVQAATEAA